MSASKEKRLDALHRLELLDAPAEPAFDRLASLACTVLNVPAVFISLLDRDRDFFLSICDEQAVLGPAREITGETFCRHALRSPDPLVIPDASTDPRFSSLDVVQRYGVTAYAGVPLKMSDGIVIGVFCAGDYQPRDWTEQDVAVLSELATLTVTEIELRDAHRTAARERERYHELVHGLDAIVWEMDARTFRFTFVSERAVALLGYPVEQWLGKQGFWQDTIVHPDDRDEALALCIRAIEEQRHHRFEFRAVAADGSVRWMQDSVRVLPPAGARPLRLSGVMVDITARKEQASKLAESESKFRQIADNVRELFWIFSPDFTETFYMGPAYEQLWGRPVQSVYDDPRSFLDAVHPDDMEGLLLAMDEVRSAEVDGVEFRVTRPDGSVRWLFGRGSPVLNAEGEAYRLVGTTVDITDRKRLQAEHGAAERRYSRLVENAPYAIFSLDLDGRFTEVNPAGEALLGRASAWLRGRHISEIVAPQDLPRAMESMRSTIAGERGTTDAELRLRHSSGELRLAHIRATASFEDGQVTGSHGIARDITHERLLQEETRLLAAALHSLSEGVIVMRADGGIIYANQAHARMLGYDLERRPLPNIREFTADEESTRLTEESIQRALEHGNWSGRVRRRSLDGRVIPLDVMFGRVDRPGDEPLIISITHDVTAEIRTEEHLRRAERLASIGTLISGVAHELNNPLHSITNFATLLLEAADRRDEDREDLEIIHREAMRAAKIVADLRLLARQSQEVVPDRARVDLNDVVTHVIRTRAYALSTHNIEVVQDLAPELPAVWAERGQMEQVIINMVVNAEQAMRRVTGERRLTLKTRSRGDVVIMHVADTGPGILPDQMDRLFDPFYTTKEPGEGTGLGLSLVYSIITEHGGSVQADNGERGAVFRIELPHAGHERRAAAVTSPDSIRPLCMLVVDDEPSIRRALSRYLSRRGHQVHVASDGAEALTMIDASVGCSPYDVILSDLRMPGLGGDELLDRLRGQGAGMDRRVVFLTGDAASGDAARILAETNAPVIFKPVELAELARRVEHHANTIHHADQD